MGLEWEVSDLTVKWGQPSLGSFAKKLDKPVKSIKISDHKSESKGPLRVITF